MLLYQKNFLGKEGQPLKGEPGKAPAFQFYAKDWVSDEELRLASLSTRGIWIDILCYIFLSKKGGKMDINTHKIIKLTGATIEEAKTFIREAKDLDFCDTSVTHNGNLTIYNRRMVREEKAREKNRIRQQMHRDKRRRNTDVIHQNGGAPSPTPTPTPSPTPYKEKVARGWPDEFKLDETMVKYATDRGIDIEKVSSFFSDFHDWAISKGAEYKDWKAAFRTRVNKAPQYGKQFMKNELTAFKNISKAKQRQINNALESERWINEQ